MSAPGIELSKQMMETTRGAEGMRDLGLSWWLGDTYTEMGVQREVLPMLLAHPGCLPSVKGEQNKSERLVPAVLHADASQNLVLDTNNHIETLDFDCLSC